MKDQIMLAVVNEEIFGMQTIGFCQEMTVAKVQIDKSATLAIIM